MNDHDAAKLSMSQATFHLCPSIFLSTLIILTLSGKKNTTKLRISENQRLSFPNLLLSASSTALTIPLTTQTHLHLPSCSPILCFPSFLSLSSTCFSIHPWLPSTQHEALENQLMPENQLQLIKDFFLILVLLWPDQILQSTGIFLEKSSQSWKGPGTGAQGCWSRRFFRSRSQI